MALQPAVEFLLLLLHLIVAWAAKWILVGRYREGVHGIYSNFYIRHWLANLLAMVSCTAEIRVLNQRELDIISLQTLSDAVLATCNTASC